MVVVDPAKKLSILINKYYSLTPLGLAFCGQRIIERIDKLAAEHDCQGAVTDIMEMRNFRWE